MFFGHRMANIKLARLETKKKEYLFKYYAVHVRPDICRIH